MDSSRYSTRNNDDDNSIIATSTVTLRIVFEDQDSSVVEFPLEGNDALSSTIQDLKNKNFSKEERKDLKLFFNDS